MACLDGWALAGPVTSHAGGGCATRRGGVPGPHAHGNVGEACGGRPACGGVWAAKSVRRPPAAQPKCTNYRGNDTTRSTGPSGRQSAATRRSTRTGERVTIQGPVKKPQPDGMSHGGGAWTAQTVKRPPQQPAQPPIRQLLGAADAQTAHPATFGTAPAHRPLGSANAETTPAGAPAAAADRTQRPDATCEGTNG